MYELFYIIVYENICHKCHLSPFYGFNGGFSSRVQHKFTCLMLPHERSAVPSALSV